MNYFGVLAENAEKDIIDDVCVCMNVCMYACVCMYVCMYACVCLYVCMYCVHVLCACMYVCWFVGLFVFMLAVFALVSLPWYYSCSCPI